MLIFQKKKFFSAIEACKEKKLAPVVSYEGEERIHAIVNAFIEGEEAMERLDVDVFQVLFELGDDVNVFEKLGEACVEGNVFIKALHLGRSAMRKKLIGGGKRRLF